MSGPSIVTKQLASARASDQLFGGSMLADYWALTKPDVNFLILITTGVGFYLGTGYNAQSLSFLALFNTLLGTLLVASGTGTLNQYIEREFDAQMRRTARRPAAAGRLTPQAVLIFGIALAVIGSAYLTTTVNGLAGALAVLTLLAYLFLYTPLKRRTPLCVLVGAFPGAMPPLIGWAAASGRLNIEAGILYGMLFLWQFPHFMAIAWMYREDYDRVTGRCERMSRCGRSWWSWRGRSRASGIGDCRCCCNEAESQSLRHTVLTAEKLPRLLPRKRRTCLCFAKFRPQSGLERTDCSGLNGVNLLAFL